MLLAVVLSGCCHVPPPQMPGETSDLLAAVRAPGLNQPTLRGEMRVDHMGPEGRISGKVYAFAASGGRLRLEAVSPLDTPLSTVAVDGQTFSLVDHERHRCLQGAADPCLVGEAIGLELSSSHVAAALVGAVPLIRHRSAQSSWDRCGYYELELVGVEQGWTERIRLEPRHGRLVATEANIIGPDGSVLQMELGQHEPADERLVPRRLRIAMPRSEADLRVDWRELEIHVELPERAWQASCPPGFPVEQATCRPRDTLPDLIPTGGRAEEASEDGPGEDASDDGPGEDTSEDSEIDLSDELGL